MSIEPVINAYRYDQDPRVASITKHCEKWESGPELTDETEAILKRFFNDHINEWESGTKPLPKYHDVNLRHEKIDLAGKRIMLVCPAFVYSKKSHMPSELFYHYGNSAKAAGMRFLGFDSSGLTQIHNSEIRTPESIKADSELLLNSIEEFKPDLIILDCSYSPTDKTIKPEFIQKIRKEFPTKVAGLITDETFGKYVEAWADVLDMVYIYTPDSPYLTTHKNTRLISMLAYSSAGFNATEKVYDLFYAGTCHRNREVFLTWAYHFLKEVDGRNVSITLHNREANMAPPHDLYTKSMSEARLVFSSGYINGIDEMYTGKIFEGMIGKALPIHEGITPINNYFVPYIHYIPVSTADEFILMARFFLKNESYRSYLANEAHTFFMKYHGAHVIWNAMLTGVI